MMATNGSKPPDDLVRLLKLQRLEVPSLGPWLKINADGPQAAVSLFVTLTAKVVVLPLAMVADVGVTAIVCRLRVQPTIEPPLFLQEEVPGCPACDEGVTSHLIVTGDPVSGVQVKAIQLPRKI